MNDYEPSINDIADVILGDGLVIMRSDTIYGIFCSAMSQTAVLKLHSVRGRDSGQGFIVLVDSVETIEKMINLRDEVRARLINVWKSPAATSVILASDSLRQYWLSDTRKSEPRICFRVPHNEKLQSLLTKTGPLCAPSANLPGKMPARNIPEAKAYFGDQVDLYINGGECSLDAPSRIISFEKDGTVKTIRSDGKSHPEDFVITRRRKLYKFARFDELNSCFHLEQWVKARDQNLHKDDRLTVEIGAGTANLSVKLAVHNPDQKYIAVDIKGDRLYQGAREASKLGLENIFFVRSDISHINDIVPDYSVDKIWITFPDPYPRKPDAKHRLSAPRYLKYYRQMLKPGGELHFKTDNDKLFEWSLIQFAENDWKMKFMTSDLHQSDAPSGAKIMTTFEKRFTGEGKNINYAWLST